jgi:hypothetical protein
MVVVVVVVVMMVVCNGNNGGGCGSGDDCCLVDLGNTFCDLPLPPGIPEIGFPPLPPQTTIIILKLIFRHV